MKIKLEVVTTLIVSDLYHKPLVFGFIYKQPFPLPHCGICSHVSLQRPKKMIV